MSGNKHKGDSDTSNVVPLFPERERGQGLGAPEAVADRTGAKFISVFDGEVKIENLPRSGVRVAEESEFGKEGHFNMNKILDKFGESFFRNDHPFVSHVIHALRRCGNIYIETGALSHLSWLSEEKFTTVMPKEVSIKTLNRGLSIGLTIDDGLGLLCLAPNFDDFFLILVQMKGMSDSEKAELIKIYYQDDER